MHDWMTLLLIGLPAGAFATALALDATGVLLMSSQAAQGEPLVVREEMANMFVAGIVVWAGWLAVPGMLAAPLVAERASGLRRVLLVNGGCTDISFWAGEWHALFSRACPVGCGGSRDMR